MNAVPIVVAPLDFLKSCSVNGVSKYDRNDTTLLGPKLIYLSTDFVTGGETGVASSSMR